MTTSTEARWLTAERVRHALDYDPKTGIFRWRVGRKGVTPGKIAGGIDSWGYRRIHLGGRGGRSFKAHVLAWLHYYGEWPECELDHRDMIRHHNGIDNLRLAGQSLNNANRRAYQNNKKGLKGAYRHFQSDCWYSTIRVGKRSIYLGVFETAEEAHAAYVAKAKELFGDFARAY